MEVKDDSMLVDGHVTTAKPVFLQHLEKILDVQPLLEYANQVFIDDVSDESVSSDVEVEEHKTSERRGSLLRDLKNQFHDEFNEEREKYYNFKHADYERKWLKEVLLDESSDTDTDSSVSDGEVKELLRLHVKKKRTDKRYSSNNQEKYRNKYGFYGSSFVIEHDKYHENQTRLIKEGKVTKKKVATIKKKAKKKEIDARKRRVAEEKKKKQAKQQEKESVNKRRKLWLGIVKKEIPKAARTQKNRHGTNMQLSKKLAQQCQRERRREALRSQKIAKDCINRARRISREVLLYWRRFDKVEKEHRKRAEKEASEQKKQDEEMREMKRQQRKLNFLITQTELYAHFMSKKMKGSSKDDASQSTILNRLDDASPNGTSIQRNVLGGVLVNNTADDYDACTMKTKALTNAKSAAQLQHQRLSTFDTGEKKSAAMSSFDGTYSLANPLLNKKHDNPQPKLLQGKLKTYQLKGMNWLVSLYEQGINGILADEMGLGKTVQSIAFLAYLAETHQIWGPFLVVAPASTLHNWQQEVTRFLPQFKVLPYWGNPSDRKCLRSFWSQNGDSLNTKESAPFHLLITSYQLIVQDVKYFQRIKWQYLVLDEAQAIKSSSSVRWKILLGYNCRNRLLLTGTPIQNSMAELWALLHFIMPTLFDSHEEFNEWFSKDIEGHATEKKSFIDQNQLSRLHMILKPFMLRRIKKDVENELSEKIEVKVICEMSSRQKLFYQAVKNKILFEDLVSVTTTASNQSTSTLMNLVMQFRKVCNHPELFERKLPSSPLNLSPISLRMPRLVYRERLRELPSKATHIMETNFSIWHPSHIHESLMGVSYGGGNSAFSFSRFLNLNPVQLFSLFKKLVCRLLHTLTMLAELEHLSQQSEWCEDGTECGYSSRRRLLICDRHRLRAPPFTRSSVWNDLLFVRTVSNVSSHSTCLIHDVTPIRNSHSNVTPSSRTVARKCQPVSYPRFLIGNCIKVIAPTVEVTCSDRGAAYAYDRVHHGDDALRSVLLHGSRTQLQWHQNCMSWQPPPLQALCATTPATGWRLVQLIDRTTLISDSGKLSALDKLLTRLKFGGHRVLIYSQMTKMIDILEEFMKYRHHSYMRLDGSSKISHRRDMVANFQSKENNIFAFLLSTRAGGLGINLTAADTVIFYDSDWNPTVDQQAMDRAHRLGQTRQVTVYRLVTRASIEEKILARAKEKSEIQNMVISGGQFKPETLRPKEVVSMLIDDAQMEAKLRQRQDDKKLAEKEKRKPGRKRKPHLESQLSTEEMKKKRGRPFKHNVNPSLSNTSDDPQNINDNSDSSQDSANMTPVSDESPSEGKLRGLGRGSTSASRGGRGLVRGPRGKSGMLAKAAASAAAAAAGSVAAYAAYGYSFQPIATRIQPKKLSMDQVEEFDDGTDAF